MPYKDNESLPDAIKNSLPSEAQTVWRSAFNSGAKGGDEEKATKIAWGAVKNAGWSKDGDKWVKKNTDPTEPVTHEFDAEVFSEGTWNGDKYTSKDLLEMVNNFQVLQNRIKPPVKLGHNEKQVTDGQPAMGWVKALRTVGGRLIATLTQVPDVIYQAIKAGRYKRISSEIFWNLKEGGQVFKRVLGGVALLGADIPAVTNLADLEKFLSQEDTNFDCVRVVEFALNDTGEIIETKGEESNMVETKELQDKLTAAEAEAKQYKAEKEVLQAEREAEVKTTRTEEIKRFCDDQVKAGKMTPAGRDAIIPDLEKHTYTAEEGFSIPWAVFQKYVKTHGKVLDTNEHGKDKDTKTYADTEQEVTEKIKEHMTAHKVEYDVAFQAVLDADPELAKAYIKGDE